MSQRFLSSLLLPFRKLKQYLLLRVNNSTLSTNLVFSVIILLVFCLGLHPEFISTSRLYSPNLNFYAQLDAFLQGRLALDYSPTKLDVDYVVSDNGYHQHWGLGVPLLWLPLEILSRVTGWGSFPNFTIFLALFLVSSLVIFNVLWSCFKEQKVRYASSFAAICTCGVSIVPLHFTLINSVYLHYEEVVSYLFVWLMLCFGTLLHIIFAKEKNNPNLFYFLSIICAFAPLIKPTGLLVAYPLFFSSLFRIRDISFQQRVITLSIFLMGVVLLLVLNYLRFGSIYLWGQGINLVGYSELGYIVRFGNSYAQVGYLESALVLLKHLFASNEMLKELSSYYEGLSKIGIYRTRGGLIGNYGVFELVAAIVGIVLLILSLTPLFRALGNSLIHRLWVLGVFAIISLGSLFYVYGHFTIASRYFLDFIIPINCLGIIGVIPLISFIGRSTFSRGFLFLCLIVIIVRVKNVYDQSSVVAPLDKSALKSIIYWKPKIKQEKIIQRKALVSISRLNSDRRQYYLDRQKNSGEPFHQQFSCPAKGLKLQMLDYFSSIWQRSGRGWDYSASCELTGPFTGFYMPEKDCLTLKIGSLGSVKGLLGKTSSIRVRRNHVGYSLVNVKLTSDGRFCHLTYCGDKSVFGQYLVFYAVGWVPVERLLDSGPGLSLVSVQVHDRGMLLVRN
jgi:hypothetical protein